MERPIIMKLVPKAFSICVLICVLSGCTYYTKMYSGPELRKDQIAVLKGDIALKVIAVDGVVKEYTSNDYHGPLAYRGFEIYLLPGTHSVKIGYNANHMVYRVTSTLNRVLSFEAVAGRVYWIYAGQTGDVKYGNAKWNPYIEDVTQKADKCKRDCP